MKVMQDDELIFCEQLQWGGNLTESNNKSETILTKNILVASSVTYKCGNRAT